MPPATSPHAWKYFTRSSHSKSATYDLCDQRFVYKGTTSNLLNHLNSQRRSFRILTFENLSTCLKRLYTKSFWLIEGQTIIYMNEKSLHGISSEKYMKSIMIQKKVEKNKLQQLQYFGYFIIF